MFGNQALGRFVLLALAEDASAKWSAECIKSGQSGPRAGPIQLTDIYNPSADCIVKPKPQARSPKPLLFRFSHLMVHSTDLMLCNCAAHGARTLESREGSARSFWLGLWLRMYHMLCLFERLGISAVIMFALRLGVPGVSQSQVGVCHAPPKFRV